MAVVFPLDTFEKIAEWWNKNITPAIVTIHRLNIGDGGMPSEQELLGSIVEPPVISEAKARATYGPFNVLLEGLPEAPPGTLGCYAFWLDGALIAVHPFDTRS